MNSHRNCLAYPTTSFKVSLKKPEHKCETFNENEQEDDNISVLPKWSDIHNNPNELLLYYKVSCIIQFLA